MPLRRRPAPLSPVQYVAELEPQPRCVEVAWDRVSITGFPGGETALILEALRSFPITMCEMAAKHAHMPGGMQATMIVDPAGEPHNFPDRPAPFGATVVVAPCRGSKNSVSIIGGYLGTDQRMHVTHEEAAVMSVAAWSRKACELAAQIKACRIIVHTDLGGKMGPTMIRTAWEALRREWDEGHAEVPEADRPDNPYGGLGPHLVTRRASQMGSQWYVRAQA